MTSGVSRGLGRGWYGFVLFTFLFLLTGQQLLRAILLFQFSGPEAIAVGELVKVLGAGLLRDLWVATAACLLPLGWHCFAPSHWNTRIAYRGLVLGSFLGFFSVQIFLWISEYFFFEEFRSRFNTVALDYLLYPHEVFVNIWDSYPVGRVVAACLALGSLLAYLAHRWYPGIWTVEHSRSTRLSIFAALLLTVVLGSLTFSIKGVQIGLERALSEIANNGVLSITAAALTRNLDYEAFYRTLPKNEAYARARKLLEEPQTHFLGDGLETRRRVEGDPNRPKLNVVIVLEESLGSEFWGSLGKAGASLTPEMDQLATREGLLFTNIFASGNRTVRGFEGVLSSFPPLPGESIVKRDRSANVETVARVLKRDGYETVFLYGGRGLFDGMKSYAINNGWSRFVEQKDFAHPTHTTIWGVCDEDLMKRSIEEFRALNQAGKPFLGTILSVSNHKPYTYPAGRISEDPRQKNRDNAVKYSDFALGQFFKAARKEAFWTNTVFVVVADHGARVYGSQSIPIHSYEIPLLIAGPAVVHSPARIGALGSSLDVAPTLLGLIGRPYDTEFFGRDLMKSPAEKERALVNHNRDVGMFVENHLVVLGLRKGVEYYSGDPKRGTLARHDSPSPEERELERDCIALCQVADDLYMNHRYHIDP